MTETPLQPSGDATQDSLSSRVPDVGQLVSVRGRQWVVSSVKPHRPDGDAYRESDLVTLESIEEDSDGRPVSVVWQLEPGARILERAGLPAVDGFDPNDRFDAFLDAIRWGIATNADRNTLLAPFRSGISIEDYQLDPLVRAVDMARVNLLVADDTGLGKTIEAGLVVQELLIRHRARSVLVVAPASNLTNWQREMREKFGLDFQIVDTDFLRQFRRTRGIRANPWTAFPFLITSMDWIKQGEGWRLLKDALPPQISHPRKFDILIVDEAHNVSPSGRGRYARESQRTKAIRRLAPHFQHHLFLSATPHNGYRESFTALLELLDDQRFARNVEPSATQLQQVMVRRLKRDIVDKNGRKVFPDRKLLPLEVDYTDEEKDIHATLQRFMAARFAAAARSGRHAATRFVMSMLKKRLFSSPRAFAGTLEKYRSSLAAASATAPDRSAKAESFLADAIRRATEDAENEVSAEEAVEEAVETSAALSAPLSAEERAMLDKLSSWAARRGNLPDSKAKAILEWIRSHLKNPDGSWNDERVILFTEFRATHAWLKQILALEGLGGDALLELHGSLNRDARDAVINAFQTAPGPDSPVRILLATDAASEGINLHEHCRYLIHVEIPWNPNVMEQRNGRIDRHGQKSPVVSIWHPVGRGFDADRDGALRPGDVEGDGEYLLRAALKVDAIREDLGSVGAVLDAQIQDAMLGRSTRFDPDVAKTRSEHARKALAMERDLRERIATLHKNLMNSREEAHLSPENVHRAVETALAMAGKPSLAPSTVPGLPPGSAWTVPVYDDAWRDASVGLAHPHTGRIRPVVFDAALAAGRDDVVLAHLNHPLVRLSLRLLREEIWNPKERASLHRVAVRSVPGLAQPMAIVWSRLLVVGGDHRRLHEELLFSGGELKEDSFRREERLYAMEDAIRASHPLDSVPPHVFETLRRRFAKFEPSLLRACEVRSGDRLKGILGSLDKRKTAEIAAVGRLLDDLEANIRRELGEAESDAGYKQMTFDFGEAEKEEFKRDLGALRNRLARIPDEKKGEQDAVALHYADPRDLSFPAAVLFLVPETSVWGCRP